MGSKTILVVDDEELLRSGLSALLARHGFRVLQAENGRAALRIIQEDRVDLVVSDLRMPGGDGVELIKGAKVRNPAVPVVIFITGFADLSDEEAYSLGACAILAKPFPSAALMNLVRHALDPTAPREFMGEDAENAVFVEGALKESNLGRGGFRFEAPPDAQEGRPLKFQMKLEFLGHVHDIAGEGVIRWVGRDATGHAQMGVEFLKLQAESGVFFRAWVNVRDPVAFIPKAA